ncbi:MAG: nucleotide exchange factor GrpE [Candidatus Omnitrophica bacterium]|nr:nucleotide exchange factor GrpE [Candidatus Omnitrophota bacterium]
MQNKANHKKEPENGAQAAAGDVTETPPEQVPAEDAQKVPVVMLSQEEYETLKAQAVGGKEATERALRIQADFENARKRLERDKLEFLKFANEEIITELIPFVDDFQRAFAAADKNKDFDVLHKGVEMILNHLLELLKKKGVTPIEAVGKAFDPSCQEVLLQVDSAEHPEHTVVEELQKGYRLNNRVLRTAKVKVTRRPESEAAEPAKP